MTMDQFRSAVAYALVAIECAPVSGWEEEREVADCAANGYTAYETACWLEMFRACVEVEENV
jgi:hypothetical protein